MRDIRVLVVDDSVSARRALGDALESEGFKVCASAPNGLLGLEQLSLTRPDVVVLDLEMPVLDGLEFLSRMRPHHPKLPVLVFSGSVGQANEATLEAMWRGASDYVLKPPGIAPANMLPFLQRELLPRLRALVGEGPAALSGRRGGASPTVRAKNRNAALPGPMLPAVAPRATREPVPAIVVVGASTGGPRALAALLDEIPPSFPVPIVIVQHMPAEMTSYFAEGLAHNSGLPVHLAQPGHAVAPGNVWLAPGGRHLVIDGDGGRPHFRTDDGPEEHACRPAVDPLFRSAAAVFGSAVLAVVLTGMGQDGLAGARAVHAAGGRVLVQDEISSVVWGMPGAVARERLAHAVVPLSQLPAEILTRTRGRGTLPRTA
jgi:two-component system chemotaxis response regulator CheB